MRGRSRIFFLAGLTIGLIVFVTAVPLMVPVERVRAGVERLLTSYAGETIRVSGTGTVHLFPGLEIEFRDVEARAAGDPRPVLKAERVRLSFDLVQYMLGRGVLASVEMLRPEIRVPPPGEVIGSLTQRDRLNRMRPASVSVRGGRMMFSEAGGAEVGRLDNLDLDYVWPRPTGRVRLGASFVWRGENVTASLQGLGPKALVNGEAGNLSLTLATPSARAAFAGQASVSDRLQLDGMVSLSAAHPLALARWIAGGEPNGFDFGRTTLDGRLKLAGAGATVSGTDLKLGDASAEGILSAQWDGARPLVRGTLGFDALSIDRAAALAVAPAMVHWAATPALLRVADLDLRLSTQRLRVESVDLAQVAATVVVKDGQLSGQIAEARLAGGEVSARLSTHPQGEAARLALDVSAERVDVARAAAAFGLSGPTGGTVSGDVRVEAVAAPPPAVVSDLTGRARFKALGLRLDATPAWLTSAGTASTASLSFDTVAAEATLGGMTVNVTRLTADGPGPGLTLTGSIDILRGGLGLSGVRSLPVAGAARQQAVTPLRLGGTIGQPVALPGAR
jgi:AsmA protein